MSAADVGRAIGASQGFTKKLREYDALFPIACRTGFNFKRQSTTDALPNLVSRSRHILPYGAAEVRLLYGSGYAIPGERTTTGFASAHVGLAPYFGAPAASVVSKDAIRRVTYKGDPNITVPSSQFVLTDAVGLRKNPGEHLGVQMYISGTTTANLIGMGRLCAYGKTWGREYGNPTTSTTDLSLTDAWPAFDTVSTHSPVAILGRCADGLRRSSVAIFGHSIVYGQVSLGGVSGYDTGDDDGNAGWVERTLASKRPFSAFTAPGDQMRFWTNKSTDVANQRFAAIAQCGFSDAIIQLEVNDLGLGPMIVTDYVEMWKGFVDNLLGMGMRVHICTPFPQTSSTDTWATDANQTVTTTGGKLVDLANWYQANAKAYGCASVIDLMATVSPGYTGKWRTDLNATLGMNSTGDGSHPSQAFNAWIASQNVFNPLALIPEFPA